ncbi:hypothetical protein INR49_023009 [Caranx melampygus]|nr:hypothetical protein INR49_023009 [Caranx melampygus]
MRMRTGGQGTEVRRGRASFGVGLTLLDRHWHLNSLDLDSHSLQLFHCNCSGSWCAYHQL